MSGIVGIYHRDSSPADAWALKAMTDAVAYRGPDGIGHWVDGPVGLGHLKLVTTPESRGERQPLHAQGEAYSIVCDGRVDNREELLRELRPVAPITPESPDAALVLYAYMAWDTECLAHIIGDFAFAVWDGVKQRLFCARDRLGLRPFNYFYDGRRFIFGSEINSLLQVHDVPRELNEVMVGLYLTGAFGDGEQTFYKGIQQLPQGTFLLADREGLTSRRYWELDADNPIVLGSDAEYVERFSELFREAVRCRLRSDGPVAVTLSGGLDSGSIACMAQTMLTEEQAPVGQLQSFSSVFKEFVTSDESKFIQEICQRYGFPAHALYSDEYWSLKPLQGSYPRPDHPFPVPHQARHEALLQQVQGAGIRVVLSGEGGDEVLSAHGDSYIWHLLLTHQWVALRRELKRVTPEWRRYFYKQVLIALSPGWMHGLYQRVKVPVTAIHNGRRLPDGDGGGGVHSASSEYYSVIRKDFARRIDLDARVNQLMTPKMFKSPYWRDQHATVQWFGRYYFLSYFQQMALWHGIEARYPFLDARLVDFLCRVPPELKVFRQERTKWLLRQAMRDILPEPVRQRPDKGDLSPLFFRGLDELGAAGFEHYVHNGILTRLGLVDRDRLANMFTEASNGGQYPVMRIISFLSLEAWLHQFLEGRGSAISSRPVLPIFTQKGGEENA